MEAGYSGTPLLKKLGILPSARLTLLNPPENYSVLLGGYPEDLTILQDLETSADIVHFFTVSRAELVRIAVRAREVLKSNAVFWVSWPKKASKIATDITEDVIREVVLPLGWVDVKVCAIDDRWSGLKLVVRKELRHGSN